MSQSREDKYCDSTYEISRIVRFLEKENGSCWCWWKGGNKELFREYRISVLKVTFERVYEYMILNATELYT